MLTGTLYFLIQKQLEIAVHIQFGHAVGGGQFKEPGVLKRDRRLT